MTVAVRDEIVRIDRAVTTFLDDWTAREKRQHALGDYLEQLTSLTQREKTGGRPVAERLNVYNEWLEEFGELAVGEGVTRADLDVLVAAVEFLAWLRSGHDPAPTPEDEIRIGDLVDRSVSLIRRGAHQLGLEYTPSGLVEAAPEVTDESRRARHSLLERLKGFDDIKAEYKKSLEFQQERLEYFYQNDAHLLTVLDYQLKNLEARPNPQDEFFAACLLYFLKQHNYKIGPYMKRFKQAAQQGETADVVDRS